MNGGSESFSPEALERLVDGEAGAQGGDLEQDAARLAEVDRAKVEPVDDRRRPHPGLESRAPARPRARRRMTPRRRGEWCPRPASRPPQVARRTRRSSRASRPSPPRKLHLPLGRGTRTPAPSRAARRSDRDPTRRRVRRRSPVARAPPGSRGARRSAARRSTSGTSSSCSRPSGSLNRRRTVDAMRLHLALAEPASPELDRIGRSDPPHDPVDHSVARPADRDAGDTRRRSGRSPDRPSHPHRRGGRRSGCPG